MKYLARAWLYNRYVPASKDLYKSFVQHKLLKIKQNVKNVISKEHLISQNAIIYNEWGLKHIYLQRELSN